MVASSWMSQQWKVPAGVVTSRSPMTWPVPLMVMASGGGGARPGVADGEGPAGEELGRVERAAEGGAAGGEGGGEEFDAGGGEAAGVVAGVGGVGGDQAELGGVVGAAGSADLGGALLVDVLRGAAEEPLGAGEVVGPRAGGGHGDAGGPARREGGWVPQEGRWRRRRDRRARRLGWLQRSVSVAGAVAPVASVAARRNVQRLRWSWVS